MNITTLFSRLRDSGRPILLIHLFFSLAGIAILAPLFTLLLQGALALSGSVAVMDQDIALLLLSPAGMIAGVLLVSILLAIAGLELGALQALAQANQIHHSLSAVAAIRYSLLHAVNLLRLTVGLTLRVLVYLGPFLAAAGLTAWWLLGAHDINYYLSEHPPEFLLAIIIGIALAALLIWFLGRRLLGWSMALPLMMFGGITPEQSFAASEQLVAGQHRLCLNALCRWLLLAALLIALPILFMTIAMQLFLASGSDNLLAMALSLGLIGAIWTLLNYLIGALNLAGFCFTIADLYQDLSPELSTGGVTTELSDAQHNKVRHLSPGRLGAIGAFVIAAEMAYLLLTLNSMSGGSDPLVIAHRGAAGAAPENTMAAIERAISDAADWVEIDVQETKDGKIIVLHDSDFMKLAGNAVKVWDGDLQELQQIDIGSWYAPEFSDQRAPTLAQVLIVIKRSDAKLVIELKYYGHNEQLEQRVVDLVEAAGMSKRVAVMSLKLKSVNKIKALRPNWNVGLLAVTAVGDITQLNVDFLAVNQGKASSAFIRRAHKAGKSVFVWTVNDALTMAHWMSMGVDGIITDEPALAKDILAQRAMQSPAEKLLLSAALFFGKPEAIKQYRDNSP